MKRRSGQGWLTGGILIVVLALCGVAHADERILDYHGDIRVAADAGITITETIRVRSEGDRIRRGIYRDVPTTYEDRFGNAYRVAFDVERVTRDGRDEPWHTERLANGVRVYVGSADAMLPPGEHTFAITYRTDRSVGYFDTHDELYWNVTGTGWAFSIDRAGARVLLPAPVPAGELTAEGYTGTFGSRGRDFSAEIGDGVARVVTTRALGPGEGLTVVVTWPKGIVYEPDRVERVRYLLTDNVGLLLALAVLLAVCVFLLAAWHRHGKDPQPGVTFAHYEPPEGYSPGAMRYIRRMGYDADTLTAAVVSLAVKGYLTIRQDGDEYTLTRQPSEAPLGPGESALLGALFTKGPVLVLVDENHAVIGGARRAHRKALRRHYYRIYFLSNSHWLLPTLLGSLVAFLALAVARVVTPAVVGVFVLNGVIQVIFLVLMKAPTRHGRTLMDKLDGFELYLKVAEKDDLDIRHPPELTPALFERYLPFAIALGVANEWARQFAAVLARTNADTRAGYAPQWYQGDFNPHRLGRFVDDVGGSFSSAIASAATPPGSSSGSGGGGFSGGGGGGGGGGGW